MGTTPEHHKGLNPALSTLDDPCYTQPALRFFFQPSPRTARAGSTAAARAAG